MLLWQERKLGQTGATTDARAHVDRALAVMSELERDFDRAQVLEALGDVAASSDRTAAEQYYRRALRIYEEGAHLTAARATLDRISRLG